jgi:inosose dehydratase
MHTRRTFLRTLATSAAVASTAAHSIPRALAANADPKSLVIGSQLYGWGQYYDRDKKPFNVDEVLSALRDAGYDYAEGSSGLSEDSVAFADKLRAKGLKPISAYTGGRLHDDKGEAVVQAMLPHADAFKKAGYSILVCNPDPIGREKTDAELETQAKNLKLLGAELRQRGLKLALHHHTPEMANGAKEFHFNFRKTDPADVGFCYDVHWVFRGGVEPADALHDYGARIHTWHLRQSRDRIWWEDLDTGDIDYAYISNYAKEHGLPRNYTVELALEQGTKITRPAIENHRRSIAFIRKVMA